MPAGMPCMPGTPLGMPPAPAPGVPPSGLPVDSTCSVCFLLASSAFRSSSAAAEPPISSATSIGGQQ